MMPRHCRYCQVPFQPSKCHPQQSVCSRTECQRQRNADYRRAKLAADSAYAEKCRESARHWRKQHPSYWRQYRESHPSAVERNRQPQTARDRKRYLQALANNTLASDLKPCPAKVWLVGHQLHELANNTLAPAQLWILEALPRQPPQTARLANNTALASSPGLPA